ncbi:MAG: hypothetical protein M1834_003775 [Cirrosporium novae-zelandiae]|nr:MAG: hypothetical protein M1834_003775 [Cirrosporium novae-zelandiae]
MIIKASYSCLVRWLDNLAPVILLIVTVALYIVRSRSGDYLHCGALLNKGRWLDPPSRSNHDSYLSNWDPGACMMHQYGSADTIECLKSRNYTLIGDSSVRRVFWATAKKIDSFKAAKNLSTLGKHQDAVFESQGVTLRFIWDPFLNSSALNEKLRIYRSRQDSRDFSALMTNRSGQLILIGGGLWHARYLQSGFMTHFTDSMNRIVAKASQTCRTNDALTLSDDLLFFSPVEVPNFKRLSPYRSATISPSKIETMNNYLLDFSKSCQSMVPWSFSAMTRSEGKAFGSDGLHIIENIANRRADVLLNLRCNAEASRSPPYPADRTCCSYQRRVSKLPLWLTVLWIISSLSNIPKFMNIILGEFGVARKTVHGILSCTLLPSLFIYCTLTDRTTVYSKAQKHFVMSNFVSLSILPFAAGIMSIVPSTGTQHQLMSILPLKSPVCNPMLVRRLSLPRSQTDEWKGWMQFIILIYHYTGASKHIGIYKIVRLLVAAYLFMTGYGHAIYFLDTTDYSSRRVFKVLIRLNFLSCILAYVMETNYLFYYFAPLASFWFLIVYLTMRVRRKWNTDLRLFSTKLVISCLLVIVFTRAPGILENIFFLLQKWCKISWDAEEWRFRTYLDTTIVYVGMVAAWICLNYPNISMSPNKNIVKNLSILLPMILIPIFFLATYPLSTKKDYNAWHPYISWIPIISFVLLRNCHQRLQAVHSLEFAWLGKCSLETYTLQYHIWLAADAKGILSLGIPHAHGRFQAGKWLEFIIISYLFLWFSHKVALATSVITGYLVGATSLNASVATRRGIELLRIQTRDLDNIKFRMKMDKMAAVVTNPKLRIFSILALMWLLNWRL